MVKAVRKRVRGAPEPGAPAPATGHSPCIPFLTALAIDFLRFGGHFCCPVWVLGRDSFWGRVWYGLRTNLSYTPFRSLSKSENLLTRPTEARKSKANFCRQRINWVFIFFLNRGSGVRVNFTDTWTVYEIYCR